MKLIQMFLDCVKCSELDNSPSKDKSRSWLEVLIKSGCKSGSGLPVVVTVIRLEIALVAIKVFETEYLLNCLLTTLTACLPLVILALFIRCFDLYLCCTPIMTSDDDIDIEMTLPTTAPDACSLTPVITIDSYDQDHENITGIVVGTHSPVQIHYPIGSPPSLESIDDPDEDFRCLPELTFTPASARSSISMLAVPEVFFHGGDRG